MSVMSTPSRLPWLAAIVALMLIWCLWTLEIPQTITESRTVKAIQQGYTQAEENTVRLALEAIGNGTSAEQLVSSSATPSSVSTAIPVVPETPAITDRPLVLFAYAESKEAGANRFNLEFFIKHGLHANADFVFILNGETNVESIIPERPNIRFVKRANDCYDLGAYAEVLTKDDLYKEYTRFIMLNASIRGPFVPYWSRGCWTDMYLGRITEEVKLVGMTANCWPALHVQSMIWATDITGLTLLLFPPPLLVHNLTLHPNYDPLTVTASQIPIPPHYGGINACFHVWGTAVGAEIGSTALIQAAGYEVDVMMAAFHGAGEGRYEEICDKTRSGGDMLWEGKYFGGNVHPFETVFMKSNRDVDGEMLDHLTEWTGGRGYSSYDVC